MYFILFDPIFWISHTLATFDRIVAKLQKQIEKVDAELDANKGATEVIGSMAEEKVDKIEEKAAAKFAKMQAKKLKKELRISDKAGKQINSVRARNRALSEAKQRAANAAKNINKLMED